MYLSFYLSIGTSERAQARLRELTAAAAKRRRRLRQNALGLGLCLVVLSSGLFAVFAVADDGSLQHMVVLASTLLVYAATVVQLTILPTDRRVLKLVGCLQVRDGSCDAIP